MPSQSGEEIEEEGLAKISHIEGKHKSDPPKRVMLSYGALQLAGTC